MKVPLEVAVVFRRLKRKLPAGAVVSLSVENLPVEDDGKQLWAVLQETGRRYLITLHSEQSIDSMLDGLIHEYAHILNGVSKYSEHSNNWGRQYARCYRVSVLEPL